MKITDIKTIEILSEDINGSTGGDTTCPIARSISREYELNVSVNRDDIMCVDDIDDKSFSNNIDIPRIKTTLEMQAFIDKFDSGINVESCVFEV